MASDPEAAAAMLEQLLRGGGGGGDRQSGNLSLTPIMMAMVRPAAAGDTASPPPSRVVLINPRTRSMVVLRGEAVDILMGGSGRSGTPPASKASIEGMRTVEAEELEAEQECAVCLDEFGVKGVKEMPCKHQFHGGCIEKWLGMHGSCPVCRFQMPEEERSGGQMLAEESGGGEEQQAGTTWMVQVSITIAPAARGNTEELQGVGDGGH